MVSREETREEDRILVPGGKVGIKAINFSKIN